MVQGQWSSPCQIFQARVLTFQQTSGKCPNLSEPELLQHRWWRPWGNGARPLLREQRKQATGAGHQPCPVVSGSSWDLNCQTCAQWESFWCHDMSWQIMSYDFLLLQNWELKTNNKHTCIPIYIYILKKKQFQKRPKNGAVNAQHSRHTAAMYIS